MSTIVSTVETEKLNNSEEKTLHSMTPNDVQKAIAAFVVIQIIICVVVAVSNALILLVLIKNKKLRQDTSTLVIALAVADLWVGLFMGIDMTMNAIYFKHSNLEKYLFVILEIISSATQTSINSSMIHLLLIAADRFLSIMTPFRYNAIVTPRVTMVAIATSWTLSFIIYATSFLLEKLVNLRIVTFFRLSLYIIVISLLAGFYGKLGFTAFQHRKRFRWSI